MILYFSTQKHINDCKPATKHHVLYVKHQARLILYQIKTIIDKKTLTPSAITSTKPARQNAFGPDVKKSAALANHAGARYVLPALMGQGIHAKTVGIILINHLNSKGFHEVVKRHQLNKTTQVAAM